MTSSATDHDDRRTTRTEIGQAREGTIPARASARRSISRMWTTTLVTLMIVVLGLGIVSYASTLYQRSAFDETTSQFEDEISSVVDLVRGIRSIDVPMGSIFYQFGSPAQLKEHVRTFEERSRQIDGAFDHAQRVLPVRSDDDPLGSARTAWDKTVAEVIEAQKYWGTSHVSDALAAGKDPFSDAWQRLRDAQGSLTELTVQSLAELREHKAAVNRVQGLIPPIVLGALALTLAIGAWSARRLSRRIVAPLLLLRGAAMTMRDGHLADSIDIGKAGAELHDLAFAMNEMAGSLNTSHGMLRQQATTDALTGLPNRKAVTDHLRQRIDAGSGDGVALLFVDLDDFKTVNDSLGHAAGDELLRIVAGRLRSSARDIEMVARLGGDEFAVVLEAENDPSVAVAVADRILVALGEPLSIEGTTVSAACSIGIALIGAGADSVDELVRNADIAMYMAKSRGKSCYEVFAHTMHSEMLSRMTLKADLARAAELGQLELRYQPVVDLATLDILGWEALVRWQHPERGLLSPADFIPLAEDTGDIVAIGDWVLDRACADRAEKLERPGLSKDWVSVNVSPQQLARVGFADTVRHALNRHGVKPASLILEITEAALLIDTERAAETLAALQRDGIRIAVDDFGTGFSSLRYLQDLPVDIIKIDRSFISGSEANAAGAGMLDAILTLGQKLGLDMIAEGIEHRAELERLQSFGRLAGQGYLIARPMPVEQAARLCSDHRGGGQTGNPFPAAQAS